MVDDHRRVEPRPVLTGSGMQSDPEHIEELTTRAEQYERATRPPPKRRFGEVLDQDDKKRKQAKPETEEERKAREEAEAKDRAERRAIRELMGSGAKHPDQGGGKRKVALKG
jgi:hypothetical protein